MYFKKIIFLIVNFSSQYLLAENSLGKPNLIPQSTETWINIFVHGTVGSFFSLVNFPSVKKDDFEDSLFKKLCIQTRTNPYFYKDQIISDIGMHQFFLNDFDNPQALAATKILEGYELVNKLAMPGKDKNLYFLYGWAGFLSQKQRRYDAALFYNDILKLKKKLKDSGVINPRFRIFGHSHGGNVALNLAGIFYYIFQDDDVSKKFYSNFEIGDYVKFLFTENPNILELPKSKIFIDELVMLGTPIQEETALFMASEVFGKIFNIYSKADTIQGVDFVSTRSGESRQTLEFLPHSWGACEFSKTKEPLFKNLYQIQVVIKSNKIKEEQANRKNNKKLKKKKPSLFSALSGNNKSMDPTHKELWFITSIKLAQFNWIKPIPIVTLYPILVTLNKSQSSSYLGPKNYKFEILEDGKMIKFSLKSKELGQEDKILRLKRDIFETLRQSLISYINSVSYIQPKGFIENLIKIGAKANA